MGTLALVGLGSNLGDRRARLDAAVAGLAALPGSRLLAVSTYHETAPVGGPSGQATFLNAAASLETTLAPDELLRELHALEDQAGRVRYERWGARALDLDLLIFGGCINETAALRLPHPRMAVRRFVLAPAAEVAPDAIDPVTGRTIAALLANLDRRPGCLVLIGPARTELRERLGRRAGGAFEFQGHGSVSGDNQHDKPEPADRWMVTDLWPGTLAMHPTVMIATSPESYWERYHVLTDQRRTRPPGGDVPLLWPGSNEPVIGDVPAGLYRLEAGIVTACEAMRAVR